MLMPSIFGESLFDDLFDDFSKPSKYFAKYNTPANSVMSTDVKETDDKYEMDISLPGYNKEDIKMQLKNGYLTITAQTQSDNDQKDDDGKYIRRERFYGTCSRNFYVGKNLTQEDITAKFENGVLKVSVPKKEKVPAVEENKYIAIEG